MFDLSKQTERGIELIEEDISWFCSFFGPAIKSYHLGDDEELKSIVHRYNVVCGIEK